MPRLAAVAALALACLLALSTQPADAKTHHRKVPSGFFGVDYDREIAWGSESIQSKAWASAARSGVESARVIFDWRSAQPVKGQPPSFAATDRAIALAAAHGITPLPVVMLAPTWARVLPAEEGSAPSDIPAYQDYLRALIARYGPAGSFWKQHANLPKRPVRMWQVWNEPDVDYQWRPRDHWQQRYGELLRAGAAAIRGADPGATVVMAALTNDSWNALDQLYEQGGIHGYFDAVALNAYSRIASHVTEIIKLGRDVMNKHGDGKRPIFVTEFGASASRGKVKPKDSGNEHLQTTDKGLAHLVTKTYALMVKQRKKLGIRRTYWYTLASDYDAKKDIFDFTGLLRFRGGKLSSRPALGAYSKAARAAEGCRKDARAACAR